MRINLLLIMKFVGAVLMRTTTRVLEVSTLGAENLAPLSVPKQLPMLLSPAFDPQIHHLPEK